MTTEAVSRRVNELYHDLQAGEFDHVHSDRHKVERSFWMGEALPRITAIRQGRGLDLCTGTGFVPELLLQHLPATFTITCLDISSNALAMTASRLGRFPGRFSLCKADVTQIPLADASVDWVSVNAALHHMPDVQASLREVRRVLKPGGYFFVGYEPNLAFFNSGRLVMLERFVWHLSWYTAPSHNIRRLGKLMSSHGPAMGDEQYLPAINETLVQEGLIEAPITVQQLRQLVDLHSHAQDHGTLGLDPAELLDEVFQGCHREVSYTDYGGEALRKHRALRSILDRLMRRLAPRGGMLFSWIVQKPMTSPPAAGSDG